MLIAQITDIHLGFRPGGCEEPNRRRFDKAIEALRCMQARPDLLLVTGDILDSKGDAGLYGAFREAVADLPFPVHPLIGNHDQRSGFLEHFPDLAAENGFVQYAIEDYDLRILILDTVEEGRHAGAYCERRAAWLRSQLDAQPERPTLIAFHHPPVGTGLSWMKEDPGADWIALLRSVVEPRDNIAGLLCGHLHRPVVTRWAGTMLVICPATAPLVALDLGPIDLDRPDERPMIVDDGPYFALHAWDGRSLFSHFDIARELPVLARFGPEMQPFLKMLARERNGPGRSS
ncbi:phosphodiesterase [Sphingosinicella rhizophila]|uniref:Phosphodiesterase n=1 Tax=Sphingosinicella rhizophila TaxID=3050082 RepID=A0ABU3QAM1_9SPHN|nr:phosphodiesterase [Sphingosinicella sp. GR2756]MDT9600455.1 phosphodiesterase [Sphingosinicella sp. GR2756]